MHDGIAEIKQVNYVDRVYESLAILSMRDGRPELPCDLRLSEHRIFSQNGEDGVIDSLVRILGSPQFFVEFGVGDGWSCNTRLLAEVREWSGLFIEIDEDDFKTLAWRYRHSKSVTCLNSAVTPSSISTIFETLAVPNRFGVLSIDIDGQDFWVWKALSSQYRPDIVIIEFNAEHDPETLTVEVEGVDQGLSLGRRWGASLGAVTGLAAAKGYELVHVEMTRVNAFFVAKEILAPFKSQVQGRTSPGSPNYGLRGRGLSDHDAYQTSNRAERETMRVKLDADKLLQAPESQST